MPEGAASPLRVFPCVFYGDDMAKKKNRLPPFVYVTKEMLKSDAYKALTNASRVALLLLKAQMTSNDQNEVKFPYSHVEGYMQKRTFARAIRQLEEMGFIVKTQEGGMYRRTNIYTFSYEWKSYLKQQRMAYYIRGVQKHTVKEAKNANYGMQMHTVRYANQ